jgi:hypothetical protein
LHNKNCTERVGDFFLIPSDSDKALTGPVLLPLSPDNALAGNMLLLGSMIGGLGISSSPGRGADLIISKAGVAITSVKLMSRLSCDTGAEMWLPLMLCSES